MNSTSFYLDYVRKKFKEKNLTKATKLLSL